ncbi:MAG: PAS domain-containing protein [Planctomycetaceae bacterium]|nr:PAS domain-containing protein [Planctomycetaceae bacterium]
MKLPASSTKSRAADRTHPVLSRAMERFEGLSRDLLQSYTALEQRAAHVERELAQTNRDLASKVTELDRVTRELETLLAALPTGVVVLGADGSVTRANPAALAILDCTRAEEAQGSLEQRSLDTAVPPRHVRLDGRDGANRWISVRTAEVPPSECEAGARVLLLDDQTEVRRLDERVHTLDKMCALGTLAAGVAHEIRNPLSAVLGFASLLCRELPDDSRSRRWAQLIERGALETDEIVTGLLTFARPGAKSVESVDIDGLVEEVFESLRGRRDDAHLWKLECMPSGLSVECDRVKLRQALRNLVANGIEAQPKGGVVRVRAVLERDSIALTVCDNGPGVPAEIRSRVLEPFYTTRAEGTGLGLALAHTVAQLHGGRLEVTQAAGDLHGACFVLHLSRNCQIDLPR